MAIVTGTTVGPLIADADFAFSREYWAIIGVAAFKSAAGAAIAYVARKKLPPSR